MTDDPDHIRRKRLLFRAEHRGTKEADLVVGGFARKRLPDMTSEELDLFEQFLTIQDADIMSWVMRQQALPNEWDFPLIRDLLAFELGG